jgi:DNA polymerase I-like protein with 3'-5' exonuclease and polymerase domains
MIKPIQANLFSVTTNWVPPSSMPDLSEHKEIAIDLETRDPNLMTMGSGSVRGDGEVIGIAVAVEGWSGYFPINHEGGGNMDRALILDWFEEVLATPADKIFHNAMYDVCWIRAMHLKINGRIIDTMIAASLVDENRFSYTLNSVAKEYVGIGKNEKILQEAAKEWGVNPKSEMWRLPAPLVGEYAEQDAVVTLKLWHALQHEISKQDLWDIFNLETNLFPCLVDMKFKGVRVDVEGALKAKERFAKSEKTILHRIKQASGIDLDIWATASIVQLFDKMGIKYGTTEKGAPSFTKGFLYNHTNEIVNSISQAREFNKAHTTFIDTIIKHEHNGRIHADINQLRSDAGGTVTGRFSYSNPNLQQIPASKLIGKQIRGLFLPEKECTWGCFDYSQQEPRILVHFAMQAGIQGVEPIAEGYKAGKADFHQMMADMAGIERKQAKTINLGIMYGMGKMKLMGELGTTKEEAEDIYKTYKTTAPFVNDLYQMALRRADLKGKIRTVGGRLCRFNLWEPHGFGIKKALPHADALAEHGPGIKRAFTYKALNKLIQGSAADMTKKAMLALYNEGIIPHIQIHDELDISVKSPDQAKKIIEVMEAAVTLEVPNKVDYEKGANWGDIH